MDESDKSEKKRAGAYIYFPHPALLSLLQYVIISKELIRIYYTCYSLFFLAIIDKLKNLMKSWQCNEIYSLRCANFMEMI